MQYIVVSKYMVYNCVYYCDTQLLCLLLCLVSVTASFCQASLAAAAQVCMLVSFHAILLCHTLLVSFIAIILLYICLLMLLSFWQASLAAAQVFYVLCLLMLFSYSITVFYCHYPTLYLSFNAIILLPSVLSSSTGVICTMSFNAILLLYYCLLILCHTSPMSLCHTHIHYICLLILISYAIHYICLLITFSHTHTVF
jgi:hypothetical protein